MTVGELIRKLTEAPGGDLYVEILQTDSRSLLLLVEENGLTFSGEITAVIDMDGEASKRCDGCGGNKATVHTYANQHYCSSCCKDSVAAGGLNVCPKCQGYVNDGDVCCGEASNV